MSAAHIRPAMPGDWTGWADTDPAVSYGRDPVAAAAADSNAFIEFAALRSSVAAMESPDSASREVDGSDLLAVLQRHERRGYISGRRWGAICGLAAGAVLVAAIALILRAAGV